MKSLSEGKNMGLVNQLKEQTSRNNKILHDLHAPLINITGFSTEIRNTLLKMDELLRSNEGNMESQLHAELVELIANDLFPCIKYIDVSRQELSDRLDSCLTE